MKDATPAGRGPLRATVVAGALVALLATGACTSLLGDFDTGEADAGPDTGVGTEGGIDTGGTDAAGPIITGVSPAAVAATSGGQIEIQGRGFQLDAAHGSVTVDGVLAPVSRSDATTVVCTAAPHAAGTFPLVLTNANGDTASSALTYAAGPAPVVVSVTPDHVPAAGGAVTIAGRNFVAGAAVTFGTPGVLASAVQVDATSITCTAPAHASGPAAVTVTNPDGQAASGTVTYDPGTFVGTSIAGCALWLRADTGVTANAGAVAFWADQSGAGRHFTQASPAHAPTVVSGTSGINGRSAIKFSGSPLVASMQYLTGPTFAALAKGAEIFVVMSPVVDGKSHGFWRMGPFNDHDYAPYVDSKVYATFGTTTRYATNVPLAAVPQLFACSSVPGEWALAINDVVEFKSVANTVGWEPAGTLLGATTNGGVDPAAIQYTWAGLIAEIVAYDHKLSPADHAAVVGGLRALYATP